ncbi:MAG: universal stress protein [Candidatus Thorarchaeota archaeon]|nr:MAG: universal stress protein [Candidatus Thorarchaeota archaeon]
MAATSRCRISQSLNVFYANHRQSSTGEEREIRPASIRFTLRGNPMSDAENKVTVKSILVAVDGSAYSEKAVRYACAMGPALHAEIVLLHVVPMMVSATPYHDTVSDQPFLALQQVGEDILSRAKRIATDLGCEVVDLVSNGDPASRIIEIASERGVDLIIMGSRGVSGLKRLFTGSISDKVSKQAPCPVMIVR